MTIHTKPDLSSERKKAVEDFLALRAENSPSVETPSTAIAPFDLPAALSAEVSRSELVEFIRGICEDSLPGRFAQKVSGVRAIEFAAWDLYRRLQEGGEL